MEYCRTCGLAGDSYGDCGNSVIPCPTPVKVNPKTQVVITCTTCGVTIAFSAVDLLRGKPNRAQARCKCDTDKKCRPLVKAPDRGPKLIAPKPEET